MPNFAGPGFFSIDLDTGLAQVTTPIPIATGPYDYSSIAMDASGTLYAVNTGGVDPGLDPDELRIIDRSTGAILQSIPLDVNISRRGGIGGMDMDPETGVFYLMDNSLDPELQQMLYTLDVSTGNLTAIGEPIPGSFAHGGFTGLAAVVPIPPAMWLFGSGLLGLVGIARRKKAA